MSSKAKSHKKYDFSSSDDDPKYRNRVSRRDGSSSSSRSSSRTLSNNNNNNTDQQKSSNRSGRHSRLHQFTSSSSRSSSREKRPISRKSANNPKVSSSSIASVTKSRRTPTNRHRSLSSSSSSSSRNNRKFMVKSDDEDVERYSSMPIRVIVGEKPPIDTSTFTRNKSRAVRSPSLEKPASERFNRASNRFESSELHLSLYSNSTNEMTDVSPLNTPPPQPPSKNKSKKKVSVNPILDMSVLMKAIEKDSTFSVPNSSKRNSEDSEKRMRKEVMLNNVTKISNKKEQSYEKTSQRLTSAALNRMKEHQRIEKENQMILKRLIDIKPTKCLERAEQLKEYNKIMYNQTGSGGKVSASRSSSKAGSAQRSYTSLNYSNSVSSFTPTSATSSSTVNKTSGSRASSSTANYRSSSAKLLHNISAAKDFESLANILGNSNASSIRPAWTEKW